jgi:hypothetical protein
MLEIGSTTASADESKRKVLVAKAKLLDAALSIVIEELKELGDGPKIVIDDQAVQAAAVTFVVSPAFAGSAAMLSFSARVEGGD